MPAQIPILKFGGRTLQGRHRFGPDEEALVRECHELADANAMYRLLEQRRNQARAARLREIAVDFVLPECAVGVIPVVVV